MSTSEPHTAPWDAECLLEEARHEAMAKAPPSAPILLGRLPPALATTVDAPWSVRVGGTEFRATVDASVDPTLLREAAARGAAVLVDWNRGAPIIVGVLTTQRSLTIDDQGRVDATVESLRIVAKKKLVLSVTGAFVQLADREAEIYGTRVLVRARELAKTLAAMISFN